MENPNWFVVALIGAFLSWIVPLTLKMIQLTIKFMARKHESTRITGSWYVYEFTRDNGTTRFTTGTCTIKRGFFHDYTIQMRNDDLHYSGHGKAEGGNHFWKKITNNNDKHVHTETCWQRYDFGYSDYATMYGMWLSNNYCVHLTAGISILSKKRLTKAEVENIVHVKYGHDDTKVIFYTES